MNLLPAAVLRGKMKNHKRNFDTEAERWDEKPGRVKTAEEVARAIRQQIPLKSDMNLLDFGCGTGLLTLKIAPLVKSITGADTSQGMIDVLKAKINARRSTNINTEYISPGDSLRGSYDAIISNMTFHHIEDIAALLAQMFQSLRIPGYLAVADLDPDQGEYHEDNSGVYHPGFERRALKDLFRHAGFSGVRDVTAAEVIKPVSSGNLRKFSIFLIIGEKIKL